jgi:predicted amidophosphoribosyltransferase
VCAGQRLPYVTAQSPLLYEGLTRQFVSRWKERGGRALVEDAAEITAAEIEVPAAAVVTWVPPDATRLLRRGHHPARSLAIKLAERWELDAYALLRRTGPSRRQTQLNRSERLRNVRGAFSAVGGTHGSIVLVDDVLTTGATVASCAETLVRSGAERVHVVTFARASR